MSEVVLPRRAVPQPRPSLVPGGDCGACVLAGVLGLTVEEAYARTTERWSGQRHSLIWAMLAERALPQALRDGLADRIVTRPAHWTVGDEWSEWGNAAGRQSQPWATHMRMAFDAGYYGLASVSMNGGSVLDGPDHWVLLCGWRPGQNGTCLDEVLVSCSARHPKGRWMRARDFLVRHGGFNALLVRPT